MNDILEMYKEDLLRAILEFGTGNGEADAKDLLSDVGGDKLSFRARAQELWDSIFVLCESKLASNEPYLKAIM